MGNEPIIWDSSINFKTVLQSYQIPPAILTPSGRFHLAADFSGLRRSGYWSLIINQAQGFPEQVIADRQIGQLERDLPAMEEDPGPDFHKAASPFSNVFHGRPWFGFRQCIALLQQFDGDIVW